MLQKRKLVGQVLEKVLTINGLGAQAAPG